MNEYRKSLIKRGGKAISDKTLQRLEARYDELLEYAKQERKDKPSGLKWATQEETAPLNRLKKYKRNHLLFLHDFNIPFDNNMSERALRKCKNRQKMSGGFPTESGKKIFCYDHTLSVPKRNETNSERRSSAKESALACRVITLQQAIALLNRRGFVIQDVCDPSLLPAAEAASSN